MRDAMKEMFRNCQPKTHRREEAFATLSVNEYGEVVVHLSEEARRRYEQNTGEPCPCDQVLCRLPEAE